MPKKNTPRAGAIEGIRWFFSDERPAGPPPKPFFLTYVGEGVAEVPDVGAFQNGTTAEIGRRLAEEYRARPDWLVTERPRGKRVDDYSDDEPRADPAEVSE